MKFTTEELGLSFSCDECEWELSLAPDELLSHLVEGHEYLVSEAERKVKVLLLEHDDERYKDESLIDYYGIGRDKHYND